MNALPFGTAHLVTCLRKQHSADGSIKYVWRLADDNTVESIYFTFRDRYYTCISSQVGCNVGCPFCATGKQRALRSLTANEMVEQVLLIRRDEDAAGGPRMLDEVVFAGMGEPLLNYREVVTAATHLRRENLCHTVSVSTAGVVPRIYELAEVTDTSVNTLFISLHALTDELRTRLVPMNKKYPLGEVLQAAQHFAKRSGNKVIATYLLFNQINDSPQDLGRFSELLDPRYFIVQLSEWNPIDGEGEQWTVSPHLDLFQETLARRGFEVFVQRSKGRDIQGGCGQLRSRTLPVL